MKNRAAILIAGLACDGKKDENFCNRCRSSFQLITSPHNRTWLPEIIERRVTN